MSFMKSSLISSSLPSAATTTTTITLSNHDNRIIDEEEDDDDVIFIEEKLTSNIQSQKINEKILNNINRSQSIPIAIIENNGNGNENATIINDDDHKQLKFNKNAKVIVKNDDNLNKTMIRLNLGGGCGGGGNCNDESDSLSTGKGKSLSSGSISSKVVPLSSKNLLSSKSSNSFNKSTINSSKKSSIVKNKNNMKTTLPKNVTVTNTIAETMKQFHDIDKNVINYNDNMKTYSKYHRKQQQQHAPSLQIQEQNHHRQQEDFRFLSKFDSSCSCIIDEQKQQQQCTNINTARSPSNSSETSSAVSSCCESSDNDQCYDLNENIKELFKKCDDDDDDVHAPDSPDSGVSGSLVHSPGGKSFYEESSNDYFQSIFPTPAKSPIENLDKLGNTDFKDVIIPHYISGDKCDSLLDLIQLKNQHMTSNNDSVNKSKHIESKTTDEYYDEPMTIDLDKTITESDENNSNDQTIVKQNEKINNVDKDNNNELMSYEEILKFSKEIEDVVDKLYVGGFDSALKAMYCDNEKEREEATDRSSYEVVDQNSNQISSSFEFGFDFPMDQSTSNNYHDKSDSSFADSFEKSIRTQDNVTTDMQTMIKQMKLKAQSIHKNNQASIVKKQKTFCCQWHDCDWPGNYEDLAEHLREIHVELQPFLDSNGKVIKWNKNTKSSSNKLNKFHNNDESASNSINDDFDGSVSQTTMDDETNLDSDDEECSNSSTEDDNQSSRISTRRSKRFQSDSGCSLTSDTNFPLRRSSKKNSMNENSNSKKLEKFVCLWRGCKVFGKPSLSRNWIERHVLEQHSGPKPFKCIVDGCGQRFRTQNQLEKHVNMHFKTHSQHQQSQSISPDLNQEISKMKKIPPPSKSSSLHALISSSSSLPSSSAMAESNEPKLDKCCKCLCHAYLCIKNNCDNSNVSSLKNDDNNNNNVNDIQKPQTTKHRMDKTKRSPSVDSVISLQSTCSTASIDDSHMSSISSSSSTSISSITQQKCLSKTNNKFHFLFDNHTECCCLSKYQQQLQSTSSNNSKFSSLSSSSSSSSSILLPKTGKNKKQMCSETKVKSVANVDYLDDEFALRLSYEFRTYEAKMAGLESYPPGFCFIDSSDDSSDETSSSDSKNKIYNVFTNELFEYNCRKKYVPFESEVIACKNTTKLNDPFSITLKWRPIKNGTDIINSENISARKYRKSRRRVLPSTSAMRSSIIDSCRNSQSIFERVQNFKNGKRIKFRSSRFELNSIDDSDNNMSRKANKKICDENDRLGDNKNENTDFDDNRKVCHNRKGISLIRSNENDDDDERLEITTVNMDDDDHLESNMDHENNDEIEKSKQISINRNEQIENNDYEETNLTMINLEDANDLQIIIDNDNGNNDDLIMVLNDAFNKDLSIVSDDFDGENVTKRKLSSNLYKYNHQIDSNFYNNNNVESNNDINDYNNKRPRLIS